MADMGDLSATVRCPVCGDTHFFLEEKGPQKGLYCYRCYKTNGITKWIKWVGKKELIGLQQRNLVLTKPPVDNAVQDDAVTAKVTAPVPVGYNGVATPAPIPVPVPQPMSAAMSAVAAVTPPAPPVAPTPAPGFMAPTPDMGVGSYTEMIKAAASASNTDGYAFDVDCAACKGNATFETGSEQLRVRVDTTRKGIAIISAEDAVEELFIPVKYCPYCGDKL